MGGTRRCAVSAVMTPDTNPDNVSAALKAYSGTWEARHDSHRLRFSVALVGGDAKFCLIEARRPRAGLQTTSLSGRQGIYFLPTRRVEEGPGGGVLLSCRFHRRLQSTGAYVRGESRQISCRGCLRHRRFAR